MEQKTSPRRIIKINRSNPKTPPSTEKQKKPSWIKTPEKSADPTAKEDNVKADVRKVVDSAPSGPSLVSEKTTKRQVGETSGTLKDEEVDLFQHFLARKMEIIELERSIRENDDAIAQKMNQEKELAMRKKLEEKHSQRSSKERKLDENDDREEKKHRKHKKHKKEKKSKKKKSKDKERDKSKDHKNGDDSDSDCVNETSEMCGDVKRDASRKADIPSNIKDSVEKEEKEKTSGKSYHRQIQISSVGKSSTPSISIQLSDRSDTEATARQVIVKEATPISSERHCKSPRQRDDKKDERADSKKEDKRRKQPEEKVADKSDGKKEVRQDDSKKEGKETGNKGESIIRENIDKHDGHEMRNKHEKRSRNKEGEGNREHGDKRGDSRSPPGSQEDRNSKERHDSKHHHHSKEGRDSKERHHCKERRDNKEYHRNEERHHGKEGRDSRERYHSKEPRDKGDSCDNKGHRDSRRNSAEKHNIRERHDVRGHRKQDMRSGSLSARDDPRDEKPSRSHSPGSRHSGSRTSSKHADSSLSKTDSNRKGEKDTGEKLQDGSGLKNIPTWDDRQKMKEVINAPSWGERHKSKVKHMEKKKEKVVEKTEAEIDEEYQERLKKEIKDAYVKKGIQGPLPDKLDLPKVETTPIEIKEPEGKSSKTTEDKIKQTSAATVTKVVQDSKTEKNAQEDSESEEEGRPFRVMKLKRKTVNEDEDELDFTEIARKKAKSTVEDKSKVTINVKEVGIEQAGNRFKDRTEDPVPSAGDANDVTKMEDEKTAKKSSAIVKLGLKISDTSAALISSGVVVENDFKKRSREEGEITDSSADDESSSSDEEEDENLDKKEEPDSSGQLSESDEDSKDSKKKKKKKKDKKHKKKKKKSKKRSKNAKRSRHSRSRSRSVSPRRGHVYDKSLGVWRSRSRSPGRRHRSHSSERRRRSRSPHYQPRRSRDDFYGREGRGYRGWRSRSRERGRETGEDLRLKIDKAKLREIAIKNAYANLHSGRGPKLDLRPEELAALKSGGKSIDELTDFCKKIAERQIGLSSDSDSDGLGPPASDDDEDAPFINHPFKVRPMEPIMMNIRNAKQLPILSAAEKQSKSAELRLQFPVSSGSHHKVKESEWVPVQKTTAPTSTTTTTVATTSSASKAETTTMTSAAAGEAGEVRGTPAVTTAPTNAPAPAGALWALSLPPPPPPPSSAGDVAQALAALGKTNAAAPPSAPMEPMPPPPPPPPPGSPPPEDKVFPDPPKEPINIGAIVSERLSAMRKLQDNPHDVQALGTMFKSQQDMNKWAASKLLPGQFTGSTGVQAMSQQELIGVHPKHQAWIKKDTFTKAAPVSGGIGKMLLQRMGWNEGEGLGQNKQGSLEPLMLDVKIDRKGLTSQGESTKKTASAPVMKDLSGKHPVSALVELCNKRRWGAPDFQMVHESGPDHKKNFLFKVCINGMEYQPSIASNNKKHAKAQAASVCLQELGLIPKS